MITADNLTEPNLGAYLLTIPEVTAICGQEIYKLRLPQQIDQARSIWPAVCWFRVGAARTKTFCGTDTVIQSQYQVDAYSADPDEPQALARAIRRALVDYIGLMGSCRINTISIANDYDFGPEFEPGIYRRTTTYTVNYVES